MVWSWSLVLANISLKGCVKTCIVVSCSCSELEGGRRFDSRSDALQQGEECVPVVRAVDVGRIRLQQLMEAIGHLPADAGQDVWFHHEQKSQREKDLGKYRK